MPYLMALPFYWGNPEATREACASAYTGAAEDTIDSAARAIAKKRAIRIVTDIESSIAAAGGARAITSAGRAQAVSAEIARKLSLDYDGGQDTETKKTNEGIVQQDRKITRLNSRHDQSSYAVFCL